MKKIIITPEQRKALEKLWFVYGNNGKKSTSGNHHFIQGFLEADEDRRDFYLNGVKNWREDNTYPEAIIAKMELTQECIDEVDKILK